MRGTGKVPPLDNLFFFPSRSTVSFSRIMHRVHTPHPTSRGLLFLSREFLHFCVTPTTTSELQRWETTCHLDCGWCTDSTVSECPHSGTHTHGDASLTHSTHTLLHSNTLPCDTDSSVAHTHTSFFNRFLVSLDKHTTASPPLPSPNTTSQSRRPSAEPQPSAATSPSPLELERGGRGCCKLRDLLDVVVTCCGVSRDGAGRCHCGVPVPAPLTQEA